MIYLIDIDKILERTDLNASTDQDYIRPHIIKAQDTRLHEVLGTDLYTKIKADVQAGAIAGVYKSLLDDYIQPMLVELVYIRVLEGVRVRITNNSTQIMESEQGSGASRADLKPKIDRAQSDANWYAERIMDYLCHNSSQFPEYTSNTHPDVHPTRKNYTGGMNLGMDYKPRQEQYLRDAGFKV